MVASAVGFKGAFGAGARGAAPRQRSPWPGASVQQAHEHGTNGNIAPRHPRYAQAARTAGAGRLCVTMSEYLIAGALLALVALLWFVRARQRRSAQQDQGAESTLAAPSRFRAWRASSRLDSIQPALAPDSDPEAVALRAQREAAEEAARIEGDREAAEWEARLAAEQLAERAEEQDRVAAESQLEALTQQASAATALAAAERSEREALESLERAYADSQHERQADDGAAQAPTTPPASLPRPELTLEPAPAPKPVRQ